MDSCVKAAVAGMGPITIGSGTGTICEVAAITQIKANADNMNAGFIVRSFPLQPRPQLEPGN